MKRTNIKGLLRSEGVSVTVNREEARQSALKGSPRILAALHLLFLNGESADFLLLFIARRVESSWHALDRLRHHTTQLLVRIEHLALLLPRSDRREVRGACAALGWSGDQGPTSDKRTEIMVLFCDATLKPACDAKIAKNMRKPRSSGKCSRKTCEKKHRSRKTNLSFHPSASFFQTPSSS
jgi:hypothetical protein